MTLCVNEAWSVAMVRGWPLEHRAKENDGVLVLLYLGVRLWDGATKLGAWRFGLAIEAQLEQQQELGLHAETAKLIRINETENERKKKIFRKKSMAIPRPCRPARVTPRVAYPHSIIIRGPILASFSWFWSWTRAS